MPEQKKCTGRNRSENHELMRGQRRRSFLMITYIYTDGLESEEIQKQAEPHGPTLGRKTLPAGRIKDWLSGS